jgi:glutathione S-transferase
MSARFELYGLFLSGPSYKVALMLSLAHEPFAYHHMDLRAGAHKTDAFRAISRYGQVPALVDTSNGMKLVQSSVILDYLADKTGKFGGATLAERYEAREWLFWEFERLAGNLYRPRAAKLGFRTFDPAVLDQYMGEGNAALAHLETCLTGRDWLVGEGLTIADIDIYGVVYYAPDGGYDLSAYPHVAAWKARIEALPGYAAPEDLMPTQPQA